MIGKRLNEIKGFENIGMYVKFLRNEFLNDLLDGKVYMKNFKFFIKLEKETKEKGQGDKLEIAHVVRSTRVQLIDPETKMVIATGTSGEVVERYKETEKMPLFCITHFRSSDFVVTEIENEIITARIAIPENDQIMFKETFGDTAVIITKEFSEKILTSVKKQELELAYGDVLYQDYSFYSSKRKQEFDELSINFLFWKDNYFENQREARFILTNKSVEDHFILEIGDIRDKSKVLSSNELLTDTEFQFKLT